MTPPEAPVSETGNTPPAVSICLKVLTKRADFLALNRARRQVMATMLVQGRDRRDGMPDIRMGFTCSKKVGNAVTRNRAKRRLREVARAVLPDLGQPGWDYVLIGRAEMTVQWPFEELRRDLRKALRNFHVTP